MPRKSRSKGIGRGHGLGSAKTQYKSDMPSGNPLGRPKVKKERTAASLREAFSIELARVMTYSVDGQNMEAPTYQVMVASLLNSFGRASLTEKMRLIRLCADMAPAMMEDREPEPAADAVAALMAMLLEEVEREKEYNKQSAAWETRQ